MPASTLYPKVSGKLADLEYHITQHAIPNHPNNTSNSIATVSLLKTPIPFVGTTKLHGTHADIPVHPGATGTIVPQRRNRTVLTLKADNLGFAAFCSTRVAAIRWLAKSVGERWRSLHRGAELDTGDVGDGPIILAGEWIGQGIQRGVAIAQLPKAFVLCSIHFSGAEAWESIESYADIEEPETGILNISPGGLWHLSYSHADEGASFLAQAKTLTLAVADSCPFGKAMGVSGAGEGIVWTPAAPSSLPNTPDFWLKTKTEHFHQAAGQRGRVEQSLEVADLKSVGRLLRTRRARRAVWSKHEIICGSWGWRGV